MIRSHGTTRAQDRWRSLAVCAVLGVAIAIDAATAQSPSVKPRTKQPTASVTQPDDVKRLEKFHMNLRALESGKRKELAILQIGDSHTAADHVSGRLRALFQQRFGDAGRGFMPAGAPHAWYRPYQVAVTQSAGWKTLTSNKINPDPAIYGLAGVVARASEANDIIVIDVKSEAPLRAIEIGLIARPSHGSLSVAADGREIAVLAPGSIEGLQSIRLGVPPATRRIELRPFGDGPVEIADHTLIGANRGVSLSNVGFIGAQVSIMSRWDWTRTAQQISDLNPALVILAFGTNEGHAPVSGIAERYAAQFEKHLASLKQAAPDASLVVIGPPDANRYPRYCLPKIKPPASPLSSEVSSKPEASAPQVAPTDQISPHKQASAPKQPPPEPPESAICEPLSDQERQSYDRLLSSEDRVLCRWHTPASFSVVRRIQREITGRLGVLFFDWFELFDGECGADRWYRQGLAHKDRVHFKQDGYWRAADRLYARLMAGYPPVGDPAPSATKPR